MTYRFLAAMAALLLGACASLGAAAHIGELSGDPAGMLMIMSDLHSLARALMAFAALALLLLAFDRWGQMNWVASRTLIEKDAMASAVYRGIRFMACCLLLGQLF